MPDDLKELAERIKGLTALELIELFKELLDISGQTSVSGETSPPAEDPNARYDVVLLKVGDKKVEVIKAVREITALGLKEAKDLVEGAPKTVKEGLSKEEANRIAEKLIAAGATVQIK